MKDVVIVSAVRSAVGKGKKDGGLASVHAVDLSAAMKLLSENSSLRASTIGISRNRRGSDWVAEIMCDCRTGWRLK